MIRHTVIFTFKPDVSAAAVASALDNARSSLPNIPGVLSFSIGEDLGLQPGRSGDMAVVAEFQTVNDVKAYLNHPIHLEYIAHSLAPIVDKRISVQFQV